MAPFTLTALTETFLSLMNTPLVEPEATKLPRDVPLTDMPRRSNEYYHREHYREQDRDLRRTSRRRVSTNLHVLVCNSLIMVFNPSSQTTRI